MVRVQLRSVELAEAGQPMPADYSATTERDALIATVDELGLERFDLAGWSYGGHIALQYTLDHPERVRTLTLVEPAAMWVLRESDIDRDSLKRLEEEDRSFGGGVVTIDDMKAFMVRAGFGKPSDDFESMPSWPVWEQNRQALSIIDRVWDYTDSLKRLQALDVPILAVMGTESTPSDRAIVGAIATNAPRARLLELPGDHACHLQNLDRFLPELRKHVGEMAVR